ncbi:hypothetical protein BS50DRAFT_620251 [Corynespora cassiicola Philippines]|uniref:Zn(2)-C6 fungal-type domain-containing protein n=1 Tax=Corynespora cassiicola Philippines TaxID=1448308 RepID=A0A2T2NQS3_CORCC|nr:hypothetical protein BS50DRAFT_620251 [Corynespora cassiicola Philippines]
MPTLTQNPKHGSRRTHKKSRNGCGQCRKARIKCDEQAPRCKHCIRRKFKCDFEDIATRQRVLQPSWTRDASTQTHFTDQTYPGQSVIAPITFIIPQPHPSDMSFQQRDLFHHYMTQTSQTLSADGQDPLFWNTKVPQQALRYDFLFDAVLAFSALHRGFLQQNTLQQSLEINTSMMLHERSVHSFNCTVKEITPDNCAAAFSASIVSVLYSCGVAQLVSSLRYNDHIDQIIAVIISIWKGMCLFNRYQHWLKRMSMDFDTEPKNEKLKQNATILLVKRTKLSVLNNNSNESDYVKAIYEASIGAFVAEAKGEGIGWVLSISSEYMDLLQQKKPMAILIMTVFSLEKEIKKDESIPWFLHIWHYKLFDFMRAYLGPIWLDYSTLEVSYETDENEEAKGDTKKNRVSE